MFIAISALRFLHTQATTPALFQTKMKEADRVTAQTVPLIAQGPRPSYLNNVKLASGVEGEEPNAPPAQQSFLRKYVSLFKIRVVIYSIVLIIVVSLPCGIRVVVCGRSTSNSFSIWRSSAT